MNILLTGATGFVGLNFLRFLTENNETHQIFALTRQKENPHYQNVTWLESTTAYTAIFEKHAIDSVIHLAGKAHDTKNTTEAEAYFQVNYGMTKELYDAFINSKANKFIFLSTIKAVGDDKTYVENSSDLGTPQTPYALSKRNAEEYIQRTVLPEEKKYYILRPTLIYGPKVKGNLATLVKFAQKGLPYPFSAFENKRSYLSVENLSIVFLKILEGNYPSFTLNIANEDPVGTQELIEILAKNLGKNPSKLAIPEKAIRLIAAIGDLLPFFPFNSEKLKKITSSFVVDTAEMNKTLGLELPYKTRNTIGSILS